MLSLHLTRRSANGDWRMTHRGVAVGEGFVEPFLNPALESFAVRTAEVLLVVVRERCATIPLGRQIGANHLELVSAEMLESLMAHALDWPLQSTVVRIERIGDHTSLRLYAGSWGTAPLFLVAAREEFWAHWDPSALIGKLSDCSLNWDRVAWFLATFDTPYSRRTIWRNMHMLTQSSTLTWISSGESKLKIDYPPAAKSVQVRRLKSGADVGKAFVDILESSTRRWIRSDLKAVSELSGGLDSAIVSLIAARLSGPGWKTCGILIPAPSQSDQVERRAELIERFGFKDSTTSLLDTLPLQNAETRSALVSCLMPWEEIYYEAVDALLSNASSKGYNLLMTGFGGDELCSMNPGETEPEPLIDEGRTNLYAPNFLTTRARSAISAIEDHLDHAPNGNTMTSATEAIAYSSAMYMRWGIWPVHPLCTPELVRFCAALPPEWRANRSIERRVLALAGCSSRVTQGSVDNFAPSLAHSLRTVARPTMEALFRDSRVAGGGWIDIDQLRHEFAYWADGGGDADAATSFYSVAIIELLLRSLEQVSHNREFQW